MIVSLFCLVYFIHISEESTDNSDSDELDGLETITVEAREERSSVIEVYIMQPHILLKT